MNENTPTSPVAPNSQPMPDSLGNTAPTGPRPQTEKRPNPFKKMAINVMIGSLIGSAAIAVIAVLVGDFSGTFGKALFTLLIVTLHALACLGFLGSREKTNEIDDLKFFTNTIFVLIILSFLTAVFGIWGLIAGSIVAKLYATYFVIAFATLHGEMLHNTTGVDTRVDRMVYANFVLMTMVVLLLLPVIWLAGNTEFPGFYYRLLAASAITDATLTILAVIFHKLYIQKHPKAESHLFAEVTYVVDAAGNRIASPQATPKRRMHPLLILLFAYLILQFIGPIIFLLVGFVAL